MLARTPHFPPISPKSALLTLILASSLTACSSAPKQTRDEPAAQESASKPSPVSQREAELQSLVTQLSSRLEQMENKLTALNDKIDATRAGVETLALDKAGLKNQVPTTVAVLPNPVDASRGSGIPVSNSIPAPNSSAFINDTPVAQYRKALMLLETGKNPDSIIEFGNFLENYPDHVLAGSAQFHIGEAYFRRGEYKLATQELNRVLTTYDRSTFVPETLRLLTLSAERLKDSESATKHRETLVSLFPQSPAAREFMNARRTEPSAFDAPVQPPAFEKKVATAATPSQPGTDAREEADINSITPGLDAPPETSVVAPSIPTAPANLEADHAGGH